MTAAGVYLGKIRKKEYSVTVSWNDNIIIDDNTLIDNNIKLVQAGLKSKLKAIMDVQKCDEKTALEELERISKEQSVNGLAVDDFMNGSETDDEITDTALHLWTGWGVNGHRRHMSIWIFVQLFQILQTPHKWNE